MGTFLYPNYDFLSTGSAPNTKQTPQITVPLGGFASLEHYMTTSSCSEVLDRVAVPLLGLNSQNDPFISQGPYTANSIDRDDSSTDMHRPHTTYHNRGPGPHPAAGEPQPAHHPGPHAHGRAHRVGGGALPPLIPRVVGGAPDGRLHRRLQACARAGRDWGHRGRGRRSGGIRGGAAGTVVKCCCCIDDQRERSKRAKGFEYCDDDLCPLFLS